MNTTCHNCQEPVNRADAALRSICFTQVAYHPLCLQVELAVDAVFADPVVVVSAHAGSAA